MKYLNLGCGNHYHPDWLNIDLVSTGPGVMAHDLSKGIPLPAASCDVVYHSHVLEHIPPAQAPGFMRECARVLKPGGILRVAVPDLETICRLYLEKLEGALGGNAASAHDYEWMVIEMYDQAVREHWQSRMWAHFQTSPLPNEAFVRSRIGRFAEPPPKVIARNPLRAMAKWLVDRISWWKPVRAQMIGRFRLSGVIHQWMYDRYSLGQLMIKAGFENPTRQSATSSLIQNWENFHLDTLKEGAVYKPDSLFMEAVRPRLLH